MFSLSLADRPFFGNKTLIQRAISILRRYGQDAHIYLPGVGMLNGLTAGNYLDSAGTTAGTVDQPVGLVLDAAGSLGVETFVDASVTFVGESSRIGGNIFRLYSSAGAYSLIDKLTATTPPAGVTFQVSFSIDSVAAAGGGITLEGATVITIPATIGVKTCIAVSSGTSTLGLKRVAGVTDLQISNISVREVTGITASQPTTASKPILRRGAVNLLTYSGDMTLAPWGDVRANRGVDTVTATATSVNGFAIASALVSSGTTATAQVELKKGTSDWASVLSWDGSANGVRQWVNLSTGVLASTVTLGTGWAISQAEITSGTTGYYILTLRVTKPAGSMGINIYPSTQTDGAYGCNINDIGYVRRVAIYSGTYTAVQIQALGGIPLTTTAPASTALGPQYWSFDGSNDFLETSGITTTTEELMFVGTSVDGGVGTNRAILGRRDDTAKTGLMIYASAANEWQVAAGNGVGFVALIGGQNVSQSVPVVIDSASSQGSTSVSLNGTLINTATGLIPVVNGIKNLGLGGSVGGGTSVFPHSGKIHCAVHVTGAMSAADRVLIRKFVGQLSGVQI